MGPNPATSEENPPAAAGGRDSGRRRRLRARPPPQVLQAQQLLQLRSPAQYLRISKGGTGSVGVRERELPQGGEAAPLRNPSPENLPGGGGGRTGGDTSGGGEGGVAGELGVDGIVRRGAAPAAARSKGESLTEENERLRRENTKLAEELEQMKNLCNNILHLMSRYVSAEEFRMDAAAAAAAAAPRSEREGDGAIAKLFGVPIGIKRPRESDLSPRSSRSRTMRKRILKRRPRRRRRTRTRTRTRRRRRVAVIIGGGSASGARGRSGEPATKDANGSGFAELLFRPDPTRIK
uniref:Uncharacterized protein n=1 Tax=Ananas comosus var. bracteatus TaxID=296719 RepID=A0A6V7PX68_ANACO|nr:unnamed protein product [Ananas comosus var. bracteatus]